MTLELVVRPLAKREMDEAAQWYADRSTVTAARFLQTLANGLRAIADDPFRYPLIGGTTRRFILAPFPYNLLYRMNSGEIVVLACFHGRRDPARWRFRR